MTKLTVVVCRNFANAPEEAWTCTVLLERGERRITDVFAGVMNLGLQHDLNLIRWYHHHHHHRLLYAGYLYLYS